MVRKILLAEDSPTIQKVFELSLAKSDVALTMIDNGEDAVRLAAEIAPDLVVADVSLPVKDGFEVAAELRRSEKTKGCPVLVLAGSLAPFDEDRFKGSGADGVLFKPFESRELVNKVEEMFRSREEAAPAGKEEAAAAGPEPWDFSDVLEEVEAETAGKSVPAAASRAEDPFGGAGGALGREKQAASLGEFDVSLEDLEEPPRAAEPAAPPEPLMPEESPPVTAAHIEESPVLDAPPAITDLSPALEEVEELEEIEELEEVDMLDQAAAQAAPTAPETPEPPPVPPEAPPLAPTPPQAAAVAEIPLPSLPDALREQFSARATEIYEKVVAETVEKVLWEWMDRLSQEFSAKIRESVEAVAWEVIPATAETLIREEIARIRAQFEKNPPSSR
ncbi:MAG: response regulator [Deltaproteobacteria bacterium]|nr:response regulator [Deltaproteobacteria bacterium]